MNAVSRNAILFAVVIILVVVVAAVVILFAVGKQLPQTAVTIGVITAFVGPTIAVLLTLVRTEQVAGTLNGHIAEQRIRDQQAAAQQTAENLVASQQAVSEAQAAAAQAQRSARIARREEPPRGPA